MSLKSDVGHEGGFVCLVDGDGNYNLSEDKMTELIQHVDPKGTQDYSIVGIMGCQSTGKSTLLNRLFATQFQMMNETVQRGQTTKGIWLDSARNTNNLVIMDLEGTDSGERGEDRTTFERQTILYALALCEILMVNMWEHDIGRYTASNFGIMKTVFEVNMQLFKSRGKTQLLFIIRDYNEKGTPFATLRERLLKEIGAIWTDLSKPEEFKNSTMYDFFDFKFTYLPHFVYCRERFEEMALDLQKKFTQPNHPDSFLATEYHGSKSVPAESFAIYAHNIWNTIKDNQDLNLPTQKEMLATFRCDEMVGGIVQQYLQDITPLRDESTKKLTLTLGESFNTLITQALAQYNAACAKYSQDVVSRKRVELLQKLLDLAQDVVFTNLKLYIVNDLIHKFDEEINDGVSPNEVSLGIMERCATLKEKYLNLFNTKTAQLISGLDTISTMATANNTTPTITGGSPDNTQDVKNSVVENIETKYKAEFVEKLDININNLRKQQLHALSTTAYGDFAERSEHLLNEQLKIAPNQMWENIANIFNLNFKMGLDMMNKELATLARTTEESTFIQRRFYTDVETYVFALIRGMLPQVPTKMRDRFELLFLHTYTEEKGVLTHPNGHSATGAGDSSGGDMSTLRVWRAGDNPNYLFDKARASAVSLLQLFATFQMRTYLSAEAKAILNSIPATYMGEDYVIVENNTNGEGDGENSNQMSLDAVPFASLQRSASIIPSVIPLTDLVLLTKEQCVDYERDLDRKIQTQLTTAAIEVERARTNTGLPPWVLAVMLILGYDELIWALSNPFILFFIMLFGIGVFVLYKMNMLDPAITLISAIIQRLFKELTSSINPQPQQSQQPQPAAVSNPVTNPNLGVGAVVDNKAKVGENSPVTTPATNCTTLMNATVKPAESTTLNLNVNHNAINLDQAPPSPVNNLNSPANQDRVDKQAQLLRRRHLTMSKNTSYQTMKLNPAELFNKGPVSE